MTVSNRQASPSLILLLGALGFSLVGVQMALNGTFQAIFAAGEIRLTRDQIGILVAVNYVGAVVGGLLFGRLSDAFGRRWPLIAALIVAGLGSASMEFCHSYPELLASRLSCGIGIGAYIALLFTYYVELLPASWRGPSTLLTTGISSLLCLLTVFVMRALVHADPVHGWRLLFVALAGVSAVVALAMLVLPESPVWIAERGRRSAAAAAPDVGLLGEHRRSFLSFLAAYSLMPIPLSGFFLTVGLVMLARNYDAQISLQVTGGASGGSVIGLFAGALVANRISRAWLIIIACLIGAGSAALFALVSAIPAAMLGAAGVMLGAALAYSVMTLYAAESFPGEVRGRAMGILVSVNRTMTIVTPLVMTFVIDRIGELVAVAAVGLTLLLIAFVMVRFGGRPAARVAPVGSRT